MSELDELEKTYLSKEGVPAADDHAVSADFRENLAKLKADPAFRKSDYATRLANVKRLVHQLDSADNTVVKRQKCTVIRWEINALREAEKLG